ncbi:MAG: hypothetical protein ABIP13_00250 [Tepidiformaceae bacterium]
MLVTGDVKCLHCGYISGRWVGANGAPVNVGGLRQSPGEPAPGTTNGDDTVRCGRCEGPVFLDEPSLVISSTRLRRMRRLREQIAAFDAHRRGRAA